MEFWNLIAVSVTMSIVTGLVGFVGYHAGKRQGAKFEPDSSRDALDLRGLSIKSREAVERYAQTRFHADRALQDRMDAKIRRFNTRQQYKQ